MAKVEMTLNIVEAINKIMNTTDESENIRNDLKKTIYCK